MNPRNIWEKIGLSIYNRCFYNPKNREYYNKSHCVDCDAHVVGNPAWFECTKCKKAIIGSIYSLIEHNKKCNIKNQIKGITSTPKASVRPAQK